MAARVDELSIALVREYLNKKGYKSTLASLENEAPRNEHSISNRTTLTRELGVTHLLKINKSQPRPYRTTLEVLVNHFVTTPPSFTTPPPSFTTPTSKKSMPSDGNPITFVATPPNSLSTSLRQTMSGYPQITQLVDESDHVPITELLCEDIEEMSSLIEDDRLLTVERPIRLSGDIISTSTAQRLREVVFGSAKTHSFNSEWRSQGFIFNTVPSLSYGLVQHKGGPCGVLACVQAYILKNLLFVDSASNNEAVPQLSFSQQRELLVSALSEILWKAGEEERASVVLRSWQTKPSVIRTKSYWPDKLTEQLVIHAFNDNTSLKRFIKHHIEQYSSDNAGCALYLYSVILSRGIENCCLIVPNGASC